MNAANQHEFHPGAERLNAFAEQALGQRERAEVLAHLAACSRCRRVVMLARDAADADVAVELAAARRAAVEPRVWRRHWWFAAAPAAALAVAVALTVYVHVRNVERRAEVARIEPQSQTPGAATLPAATQPAPEEAANPAPLPQPATPAARVKSSSQSSAAPGPAEPRARAHTQAPPPNVVEHEGGVGRAPSVEEPVQANRLAAPADRPAAHAEVHGMVFGLRHAAPTVAPPPAPQPPPGAERAVSGRASTVDKEAQGQAAPAVQEEAKRQRQTETSNGLLRAPRAGAVSGAGSAAASATVASPQPPAAASQPAAIPNSEPARPAAAVVKAIHLPSGLDATSFAGAGRRELAIDETGTLFLSEDQGNTWQRVAPQWTGRAVQVRRRLVTDGALQSAPAAHAAPEGNVQAQAGPVQSPMVFFELFNDQNQMWLSTDGKTWTAQ